ncbi:helix-turn-helix transcriptional regulator [uncultured Bacteroides sp.]|uniref:helix-turn-helix domain-containing protein n=1 Tax=uncultured Bacteroides sp. TaxID=162156 RepID=UPI00280BD226|nr:helix-turn-helix transcriptional regulator [uncultured Bacteroides sp.]
MKKKNETPIHPVIEKIRKIIADRGLTQIVAAEFAGTSPSQFSKILGGEVQLSLWQLSNFATNLDMDIIDVFTYPQKYTLNGKSEEEDLEAILQIKLKKDRKEQVLKLVFGDNNLEILNK